MFEQLVRIYGNWATRYRANSARRSTRNELSKLSDYDLRDIGISRGDINYISEKYYSQELHRMKKITDSQPLQSPSAPLPESNQNLRGWV